MSMSNEPDVTGKTPLDYAAEGKTPRHVWLKRHLHYWQASRCPRSRPPNPWMPWLLLLISPSFGLFLIVLSFTHLTTLLATLATVAIIVFFNVWAFSRHRLQHISAIPSPALFGFFFGIIIQSLLCYFLYIMPQLWPELLWTPVAFSVLIACLVTLKNLYSDPGVVTSNRISDTGETMTILDVAKGVISECNFCTVCEIVMPEFTKHCRLCEICLLSLDHHCLFLLRCVARNNHRPFVFFMIEVMLANGLFVRAAVSYFNLQIFLGEASSFSEAMGQHVYVSVLFVINCVGLFYVFSLTFFQFKIITDGGTTYYSSDGRTLQRTWTDLWKFKDVFWSQRMKIFLQFLLGEYSFYKNMKRKQAQRLV